MAGNSGWQGQAGPAASAPHRLPGCADLLHGRGPGDDHRTANGTAFVADGRPTTRDLHGITCVDAVTCYAVGDGGAIVARQ